MLRNVSIKEPRMTYDVRYQLGDRDRSGSLSPDTVSTEHNLYWRESLVSCICVSVRRGNKLFVASLNMYCAPAPSLVLWSRLLINHFDLESFFITCSPVYLQHCTIRCRSDSARSWIRGSNNCAFPSVAPLIELTYTKVQADNIRHPARLPQRTVSKCPDSTLTLRAPSAKDSGWLCRPWCASLLDIDVRGVHGDEQISRLIASRKTFTLHYRY